MAYFFKPETETWHIFLSLKRKHGIFFEALNGNMAYLLKPETETWHIIWSLEWKHVAYFLKPTIARNWLKIKF